MPDDNKPIAATAEDSQITDIDLRFRAFADIAEEYSATLKDPAALAATNPQPFNGLMKYINLKLYKYNPLNLYDIATIESIFDAYTLLCYKYNRKPLISQFCVLSGITFMTFQRWAEKPVDADEAEPIADDNNINNNTCNVGFNNTNRAHYNKNMYDSNGYSLVHSRYLLTQKIKNECENTLVSAVADQNSIGSMFLLKSKFGYSEQPKQVEIIQTATAPIPIDDLQRIYGGGKLSDKTHNTKPKQAGNDDG